MESQETRGRQNGRHVDEKVSFMLLLSVSRRTRLSQSKVGVSPRPITAWQCRAEGKAEAT